MAKLSSVAVFTFEWSPDEVKGWLKLGKELSKNTANELRDLNGILDAGIK